jgi:uncharacterized protein (DUF2344 family)
MTKGAIEKNDPSVSVKTLFQSPRRMKIKIESQDTDSCEKAIEFINKIASTNEHIKIKYDQLTKTFIFRYRPENRKELRNLIHKIEKKYVLLHFENEKTWTQDSDQQGNNDYEPKNLLFIFFVSLSVIQLRRGRVLPPALPLFITALQILKR